MRRCGRCGQLKPVEEFAWRRKKKGQRHNYCRSCHSEYHRDHYLAHRQRYIDQAAQHKKTLRLERTLQLIEYFRTHPCVDCGEPDPVLLEFDHIRDKSFEIAAKLIDYSWKRILEEVEKCEVVCANCHRHRTAQRRGALRVLLAGD